MRIGAVGDDVYGRRRVARYLARVRRWAPRTLGVQIAGPGPAVVYERIVVMHPLPGASPSRSG